MKRVESEKELKEGKEEEGWILPKPG